MYDTVDWAIDLWLVEITYSVSLSPEVEITIPIRVG